MVLCRCNMQHRAVSPQFEKSVVLDAWLAAVTDHLAANRSPSRSAPVSAPSPDDRPKVRRPGRKNPLYSRSRRAARREAQRLFDEYALRLAEARSEQTELAA